MARHGIEAGKTGTPVHCEVNHTIPAVNTATEARLTTIHMKSIHAIRYKSGNLFRSAGKRRNTPTANRRYGKNNFTVRMARTGRNGPPKIMLSVD
mmetsp:Transcript_27913/g.50559  ORF Transcript_27913/g.50559 Transcript_27913/m.50559 type:complete len:95 (+) Transcript_27913:1596-1880(+)